LPSIRGFAHVYGENVNTDVLYPGRYLAKIDAKEMARHALEDLDAEFVRRVRPGDVVIAGRNFGCGSSREQAVTAMKECGVAALVAPSFARIFFRNAINKGVPPVRLPSAPEGFATDDEVEVDLDASVVRNVSHGNEWRFEPFPGFLRTLLDDGGLLPHLKKQLAAAPAAVVR
jgi:3-isopropylmalate/(R)-2-methylmalate dehydratase small subunit